MRRIPLIKKLITSKATFPVALVISICIWWLFPSQILCSIGYLIGLGLMWFMNQRFVILQGKITSFLGLFALCIASTPLLHQSPDGLYILISSMVCQSILFFGYGHPDRVQILQVCGLFIGALAIWNPVVLYLLPLIWLNAQHCKVLTWKSWVSSIIGTIIPTLFWWAWAFNQQEAGFIGRHYSTLSDWSWLTSHPVAYWATCGLLLIMLLMGISSLAFNKQGVRTQTMHYLYSVTESGGLGLFLMLVIPEKWLLFLPLTIWGVTWGSIRFLRRGKSWLHVALLIILVTTMIGIATLHYFEL